MTTTVTEFGPDARRLLERIAEALEARGALLRDSNDMQRDQMDDLERHHKDLTRDAINREAIYRLQIMEHVLREKDPAAADLIAQYLSATKEDLSEKGLRLVKDTDERIEGEVF